MNYIIKNWKRDLILAAIFATIAFFGYQFMGIDRTQTLYMLPISTVIMVLIYNLMNAFSSKEK